MLPHALNTLASWASVICAGTTWSGEWQAAARRVPARCLEAPVGLCRRCTLSSWWPPHTCAGARLCCGACSGRLGPAMKTGLSTSSQPPVSRHCSQPGAYPAHDLALQCTRVQRAGRMRRAPGRVQAGLLKAGCQGSCTLQPVSRQGQPGPEFRIEMARLRRWATPTGSWGT